MSEAMNTTTPPHRTMSVTMTRTLSTQKLGRKMSKTKTRTPEDGEQDDERDDDKDDTNDTKGVPCSVPCLSLPLPGPLPTVHLHEKKAKEDTEAYQEATSKLRRQLNKYKEGGTRRSRTRPRATPSRTANSRSRRR